MTRPEVWVSGKIHAGPPEYDFRTWDFEREKRGEKNGQPCAL